MQLLGIDSLESKLWTQKRHQQVLHRRQAASCQQQAGTPGYLGPYNKLTASTADCTPDTVHTIQLQGQILSVVDQHEGCSIEVKESQELRS